MAEKFHRRLAPFLLLAPSYPFVSFPLQVVIGHLWKPAPYSYTHVHKMHHIYQRAVSPEASYHFYASFGAHSGRS
jgi:hypothetical protein